MRSYALVLVLVIAGCTNDLMKVEFVSASSTGGGGHWFIGAEYGETIELMFKLDPDDISDPADWSVEVDGPVGTRATIDLTALQTRAAITIPPNPDSDSFRKLEDQTFTFHLHDASDTRRESRQWAATIVNPGLVPRAWLWAAFWTTDGERLLGGFTSCSKKMSVVAYVGGDLTMAARVEIDIIDVDLVSDDEVIHSASLVIEPGRRVYETVLSDPCATESTSEEHNNVDPKFTATLFGSDGRAVDTIVGPELD